MANIVAGINQELGKVLAAGAEHGRKLRGQAVVARRKLGEWHVTMGKLVPQIRYWLRTGSSPRARSSTCTSPSCMRWSAAK